jgi:hypothetical protein
MPTFWSKVYSVVNLWRQPATRSQLTNQKYIPYFDQDHDNWPIKWHEVISESPSGSSCVSTITDFLEGEGFSEENLEKLVVNAKNETFWAIHQKTCKEFAEFEGFYWLLRYNAVGGITEWDVLPFENCRLGAPDDNGRISKIHYNPFFGTSLYNPEKSQTVIYDVFNPKAVSEQMIKQGDKFKGQVFFYGTTNAQSRYYPISEAYSAIKWMKIESRVSSYHDENLAGGLLQSFMLAMIGNPDDKVNNPEDGSSEEPITRGEAFDNVVQSLMGAKRVGNIWVNWFANKDEIPQAIPMPANNNSDIFVTLDNQATKKITIAWKVPGILANIAEGATLGGDGNQVRVAVKLMQQRSIRKQRVLTDCYSQALKLLSRPYTGDVKITPYNPYPELEVLDQKIWDVMSEEEKRQWIQENTEISLSDSQVLAPAAPAPAARFNNAIPVSFPQSIRDSIKKTLEYKDKMGIKCGGKAGLTVSNDIIENKNLGLSQLKRIHNYLKKYKQYENSPLNEGCAVIEYNLWGGKEMLAYLETKMEEIDTWLNKTN